MAFQRNTTQPHLDGSCGTEMRTTRREMLTQAGVVSAAAIAGSAAISTPAHASKRAETSPFRYCLNTSTIAGHRGKTPLNKEVELIAKAGYSGVEPWIREIQAYKENGGKLSDLKKQLDDLGVRVESAIGFANWIADDETKRKQGLEDLKRDMDLVRQIGGRRIAAPPAGGTQSQLNLDRVSERYAAALAIGKSIGVTPMVELWGPSATLHRLGELMYVVVESGDPDASLLLDVYHIYRGGSDFSGLRFVDGETVKVLHMNDYPDIPRSKIGDKDRVYPGDGVAPIPSILRTMRANGFGGVLSLELFNPTYWQDDIESVLRKGISSMKAAVAQI